MSRTPTTASYFQIGLFVLITLGLACMITLLLGFERFFMRTTTYYTLFSSIPRSLQVGVFVYADGIKLGQISRISRVTGTNGLHWIQAAMKLHVRDDIPLHNREVQVSEPLIAGPASVVLIETPAPDDPGARLLPGTVVVDVPVDAEQYLPAEKETKRASFEQKIMTLLDNLNQLTSGDALQRTLTALDSVTQTLAVVNHTLQDPRFEQMLSAMSTTLGDVAQWVSNVTVNVDAREVSSSITALNDAARAGTALCENLQRILQSKRWQGLTRDVERLVVAGAPALDDARALVADLRVLTTHLTALAESLDRNPSQLLLGAPAPKAATPGDVP